MPRPASPRVRRVFYASIVAHPQLATRPCEHFKTGPISVPYWPFRERHTLFGRVRSSTVRLSSTLECVPELLNLLWGQLLAPAHNAQHLFALDLALPFASRLRFHALAIGLGVEEPRDGWSKAASAHDHQC